MDEYDVKYGEVVPNTIWDVDMTQLYRMYREQLNRNNHYPNKFFQSIFQNNIFDIVILTKDGPKSPTTKKFETEDEFNNYLKINKPFLYQTNKVVYLLSNLSNKSATYYVREFDVKLNWLQYYSQYVLNKFVLPKWLFVRYYKWMVGGLDVKKYLPAPILLVPVEEAADEAVNILKKIEKNFLTSTNS